jgi:hypothetical protein
MRWALRVAFRHHRRPRWHFRGPFYDRGRAEIYHDRGSSLHGLTEPSQALQWRFRCSLRREERFEPDQCRLLKGGPTKLGENVTRDHSKT